jgi:hypothetical protein
MSRLSVVLPARLGIRRVPVRNVAIAVRSALVQQATLRMPRRDEALYRTYVSAAR